MILALPSPVRRLELPDTATELWVKDDGAVHARYGGNKARKAGLLLAQARDSGAERVLTLGAAGSHHVLATALFAPDFGLQAAAVLLPQPDSAHVRQVLQASLAAGLEPYPATSLAQGWFRLWQQRRARDHWVPPGGSNALASSAYASAVTELIEQVRAGELPAPDWIVVPLGSGGTAAGLLAGLSGSEMRTRLLAVSVLGNPLAGGWVRHLARKVLARRGSTRLEAHRLVVDDSQIGQGYGFATPNGRSALEAAQQHGLTLEATYTAKAFASALDLARGKHPAQGRLARVLYWHTLSSVQVDANVGTLPSALERLLRKPECPEATTAG